MGKQSVRLNKRLLERCLRKSKAFPNKISVCSLESLSFPSYAVLDDRTAFLHPSIVDTASAVVIVTKLPIKDNYYTRSNIAHFNPDHEGVIVTVSTTFEMEDICSEGGIPLSRGIAATAILSHFTSKFVRLGGNYFDLWIPAEEDSVFGFCENKADGLNKINYPIIGDRARALIKMSPVSDEDLKKLEVDIKLFARRPLDRIRTLTRRNRDITISAVSTAVGYTLGKFFG